MLGRERSQYEHNDILKKFSNSSFNFDNLYLDCNGIIYDSLSKLNNTNKKQICTKRG